MNLRRGARLGAALVALAVLTAACGSSDSSDDSATTSDATTAADAATTAPSDSATTAASAESLEGATITLYSGRNEELIQGVIDAFEAATGASVEVRFGSSAEVGAALLEEGDKTPADVFFSQEVGAVGVLAKADLLSPLPDELVTKVDERFRPPVGNLWVGVTGRSRVIVYNEDLVAAPPTGIADLTDPAWKGKVAIIPGNAGFQAFITAFRVTQGDDAARTWLEEMIANDVRSDITGNSELLKAVNDGEVSIGLTNHYYWAVLAAELGADKMKAQLIFPKGDDPGGLFNASAVAITKGGADNPAALAFVEYLLSEEGQRYFVEETYEYPVVSGISDPDGYPARSKLEGPAIDLTDLDSLERTQAMLIELGLLS